MTAYVIYDTEAKVSEAILAVLNVQTVGSMDPIEFYVTQYCAYSTQADFRSSDYSNLDYDVHDIY